MHDYSIDNHPKDKVLFFLAFIAIASAPGINTLFQDFLQWLEASTGWVNSVTTAIPVFALFGFFYWIFNKFLWRVSTLRRILLVPDINGKWSVDGLTTLKNGTEAEIEWRGTITITQSWSKILIHLQTPQSSSKSVSGSIHLDEGVGYRVLYQYQNAPSADQHDLEKHSGSVELMFDLEGSSAKGYYYTDQHRNTVGTMQLRKLKNE